MNAGAFIVARSILPITGLALPWLPRLTQRIEIHSFDRVVRHDGSRAHVISLVVRRKLSAHLLTCVCEPCVVCLSVVIDCNCNINFVSLPLGFGFVSFANDEAAQKAVTGMHESQLGGRSITVRAAGEKPPERKEGDEGGGGKCSTCFEHYSTKAQ
jgi:hypothetical protein